MAFYNWYSWREELLGRKERRAHFLISYLYCDLNSLKCSVARGNFVTQAAFIFTNDCNHHHFKEIAAEWVESWGKLSVWQVSELFPWYRGSICVLKYSMPVKKCFCWCSWLHETTKSLDNFRAVFFVLMTLENSTCSRKFYTR